MLRNKNESKKLIEEVIARLNKELLLSKPTQNPISKQNNPFRPFRPEKEILFNCIDRSLALLPDMYLEQKNMDADKVTTIVNALEKLLELRKQFIQDYWSKPFIQFAQQETTHD